MRADHRRDIQGLRAVAVGLVIAYHVGVPGVTGGFIGVDVFFVISGFLITRHLLDEQRATGRIRLAAFFARRARRILPAALVVAVLTLGASALLLPPTRLATVAGDALASILFVPNVLFAARGADYLTSTVPSPFQHYWSLGVEEQFYLIWPVLLIVAGLIARRRGPAIAIAAVAVVSLAAAAVLLPLEPTATFYLLPTRAWEFAVGGLVSVLLAARPDWAPAGLRAALGWLGLAAIVGSALLIGATTPFPGLSALPAVLGTALIIATGGRDRPSALDRVLGWGPLTVVGLLSYSLYLVHWPAIELATEVLGGTPPALVRALIVVASVGAAAVLWAMVERPMLRRGIRRPGRWIVVSLSAVAVAAGLTLGVGLLAAAAPTSSDRAAGEASPREPTPFVPTDLTPSLEAGAGDLPAIYANGCHVPIGVEGWLDCRVGDADVPLTVALFGDSHAALWYPALESLAQDGVLQVRSLTKSACHAMDFTTLRNGSEDPTCAPWRAAVTAELLANPPDLVIIANSTEQATDAATLDRWTGAAAPLVAALAEVTTVVVLEDTPFLTRDPIACLGANLDDTTPCRSPVADVTNGAVASLLRAETIANGGVWVPTLDLVCPEGLCSPILGATLVYRDDNHLTATFSRSLAEPFWERVSQAVTERSGGPAED